MGDQPTTRRVLLAAIGALSIGLGAVTLLTGFSAEPAVRIVQALAVFAAGAAIIGGGVVLALVHLAGWREPESEEAFGSIAQRAGRRGAEGGYAEDEEEGDDAADDLEFRALVRVAIDELPLEFHRALEHVAIVISDGGRRRNGYGLYEG